MRLRLSQHSLPWVFSLLLHGVILLLIRWWAMVPLLPYGQGAMEVRLVSGLLGGGGASGLGEEGRHSRGGAGHGGLVTSKPSLKDRARPSDGRDEESITDPPPLRDFVPMAEISPPSRAAKEQEGKVENKSSVVPGLSPLSQARPKWIPPDPPERLRSPASDEPAGPGGTSGKVALLSEQERRMSRRSSDRGRGIGPGSGDRTKGDSGLVSGGDGSGVGTGFVPGSRSGSGRGGIDWFRLLREKIERAKRYPQRARRWGMEGTAEVQFRIARDGSVKDVTLVKSSGFPILDRATVETLKRAAPLPVIPGTIRIPISYRLHER